ncbi:MAG: phosphatase PAP2 family protein [Nocardioidaceae bacterium]
MHPLIIFVAKYGIFVVAGVAVIAWLWLPRHDKWALAVQVVVGLLVVLVLVKVAGSLHSDPRPFVVEPRLKPLIPHAADNGFPSDHTAVAAVVALLVLLFRPLVGLGLLVVTLGIGAARVAAHVHHPQDILAGLAIGAVAAVAGMIVWWAVANISWVGRLSSSAGSTPPAHTR